MPRSDYSLTVDLVVRLINCPGVWLCPNGLVSLSLNMLGSRFRTPEVVPIFPLIFNTAFNFTKTFKNISSESKVHNALARETVCCELLQWPNGYKKGQGRILATYVGILEDLLYPPEVCISSQVDLLMKPACLFPGILAPKIEIVNKASIKKIDEKSSSHRKSEDQQIISDGQNISYQKMISGRRISAQPTTFYDGSDSSRPTGRRNSEKPSSDRETDNTQLMSNGRKHKKDSSSDDQYDISPPYPDKRKNICTCNQRDKSPMHQKPVCHSPRTKLRNHQITTSNGRRASGQQPSDDTRGNDQSMPYDRRDSRRSISNGGEYINNGDIVTGMRDDFGQPIPSDKRIIDSRRHSCLSNSNGKQETSHPISNDRRDSDLPAFNDIKNSSQTTPKRRESIRQSISNRRKNSQQPIDNFQQSSSSRRDTGLHVLNNRIENDWSNSDNRRETNQLVSNGGARYNEIRDSGLSISNDKTNHNQTKLNLKSLNKKDSGQFPPPSTPYCNTADSNRCALGMHQKPVCHSPRNTPRSSRSSSVPPTKMKKQHSPKFRNDQKFVLVCSVRHSDTADSEDSDRGPSSLSSSSNSSEEISDTLFYSSHNWYQCEVCSEYDTTFENFPQAISKSKYKTLDVHLEGDLESMCTIKLANKMHERLNKILSNRDSGRRYR